MTNAKPRIIAVDWSGKKGAAESIWQAEAVGGQIVQLENGLSREALVARLISTAKQQPRLVAGFDFAFSMPSWFVQQHSKTHASGFWDIVATDGESWLKTCPAPFFGLAGTKRPTSELLRETEKKAPGAKSVFQTNGPGAVGVGSIRGMPHLSQLRSAGWHVWPFDPPAFPLVVEIYPRLLTGKVLKSTWRERLEYIQTHFSSLDCRYIERAAGSEDAFDAAVSALIMDRHVDALSALPNLSDNPVDRLEGRIWSPSAL